MKTIYAIKDNRHDPKAKYGENMMFVTFSNLIPQRALQHLDTQKPFYHTYYFTTEKACNDFFNKLWEEK